MTCLAEAALCALGTFLKIIPDYVRDRVAKLDMKIQVHSVI